MEKKDMECISRGQAYRQNQVMVTVGKMEKELTPLLQKSGREEGWPSSPVLANLPGSPLGQSRLRELLEQ